MITKRQVTKVRKDLSSLDKVLHTKRIPNDQFFRTISDLDTKFKDNEYYDIAIDGLICNIGIDYADIAILKFAFTRLKKKLEQYQNSKLQYDISNCINSIADIETRPITIESLLNNKKYIKARNGFSIVTIDDNHSYECAITNSANILEKYGRNYEAILLYDKALKENCSHGMALGNKARAIDYYLSLLPSQPYNLVNQVVKLFTEALKDTSIADIGGTYAVESFTKRRNVLADYLGEIGYIENEVSKNPKLSAYHKFVLENNLFLNYDFGYYYDKFSIMDNLFPSIIENINEDRSEKMTFMSKRSEYVFQVFNQILEDYTTSRHLLFRNIKIKNEPNTKKVCYIYTFDYSKHSQQYGELKQIFQNVYSCLDKISHLVAVYFSNDVNNIENDIYLKWFLSGEYKEIVIQKNNWQLLALNNLALDFEDGNQYNYLRIIRNRIAHTYVNINDMSIVDNENYSNISDETFFNSIMELFKIVKAAILYSVIAIAKIRPEKDTLPLIATLESEIFE